METGYVNGYRQRIIALLALAGVALISGAASASRQKDEFFDKQWALSNTGQNIKDDIDDTHLVYVPGIPGVDINWLDLSDRAGGSEVIVAVIDSGVDATHEELVGRIAPGGWNFLDGNDDFSDDMGHGTHVAGIIVANANNGIGIAGVAPSNVKILPLKVLKKNLSPESKEDKGTVTSKEALERAKGFAYKKRLLTDYFADALNYAVDRGAKVVNISFGWPRTIDSGKVRDAVARALARNVIVVAASGNNSKDAPVFPCSYRGVICVGSAGHRGEILDSSNHGGKVDILAPGMKILSLLPGKIQSGEFRIKGYETKTGSSQAAPFVSAVVATMKSLNQDMQIDEVKSRLFSSARAISDAGNRTALHGMLNMRGAIEAAEVPVVVPDFKDLDEVIWDSSGRDVAFEFPIRSLWTTATDVEVKVSHDSAALELRENVFQFDEIDPGSEKILKLSGTIKSPKKESHVRFSVRISSAGRKLGDFRTAIVISRDPRNDDAVRSYRMAPSDFEMKNYGAFGERQKFTIFRNVVDTFNRHKVPQYFAQKKEGEPLRIFLLSPGGNVVTSPALVIPDMLQVLSVSTADVNLDGQGDYVVYSLCGMPRTPGSLFLQLSFFGRDFEPLFGEKSHWRFKPFDEGYGIDFRLGQDAFSWVRVDSNELGSIAVPLFMPKRVLAGRRYSKESLLPDQDNDPDLLHMERWRKAKHAFYLLPVLRDGTVEAQLRALDNFEVLKRIRSGLKLKARERIDVVSILAQSKEQADKGAARLLISTGEEFNKAYHELSFDRVGNDFKMRSIPGGGYLDGNEAVPVFDLNNDGLNSSETVHVAMADSLNVRASVVGVQPNVAVFDVKQGSHADPFFGFLGAYRDDEAGYGFFFETRSGIAALGKDRSGNMKISRLPINRESSFPPMQFTEFLTPMSFGSGPLRRAMLFVDSTMISGERIYGMVLDREGLTRPIHYNVHTPENWIHLHPARIGDDGQYAYVFLALEQGNWVFKVLPLE